MVESEWTMCGKREERRDMVVRDSFSESVVSIIFHLSFSWMSYNIGPPIIVIPSKSLYNMLQQLNYTHLVMSLTLPFPFLNPKKHHLYANLLRSNKKKTQIYSGLKDENLLKTLS